MASQFVVEVCKARGCVDHLVMKICVRIIAEGHRDILRERALTS